MTTDSGYPLLKQIPAVLRARGYRLYTNEGRRLIDLWLTGGAAILGHTPPNILHEIKNTASRGLYSPLPHFTEGRYLKALSKIFPGRTFRLYYAPPQELSVFFDDGNAKLWRPFANSASPLEISENAPVLVPVLPGIQLWRRGLPFGLCVLAVQDSRLFDNDGLLARFPESDSLPPILLSVAVRGIYGIIKAAPERANKKFPRIEKALKKSLWRRTGIYLELEEKPETTEWNALFQKFLTAGFLLPPCPSFPVILPGELSAGEEAKLAKMLGEL
ncbi:MAG: hypothetical protein LBV17_01305 [Treponema sp.]|jgi:hypothetical protein|nr:hypothetical protein [Treponema sp.]